MHTPPRPSRRTLLTGLALASLAPALAALSLIHISEPTRPY